MDFQSAYQTYIRLKKQFDQGQLSADEFEKRVNDISATDSSGALWQIGVSTGKWYRFDGQQWVEDIPPEIMAPPPLPPFAPKATFTPPPPPIQPVYAPVYPTPAQPKSPWIIAFLVAGIVGLCCLAATVGSWFLWSYNPSPAPPVVTTLPRPTIPSAAPLIPSITAVIPSTASPEPIAGPGFDPDLVQFEDDFSNPGSGWDDVRVRDDFNTYYFEDAYLFVILKKSTSTEANPHKNFPGDVQVEVDARKTSGSKFDEYGLLCRYVENSDGTHNSYYFAISSDGLGVIYKIDHNKKSLILTEPPKNRSDVIHSGDQVNHIRGDCVGNKLTLYVNSQVLVSAMDSSFNNGGVGLRGDSETGETEIRFDNFIVYKP